jgi:CspA family cold shock protein
LGKVLWFNSNLGYGFIMPEDKVVNKGVDLFVHYHSIVQGGFKTLMMNDIVEFALGENKKGPCALDVKLVQRSQS